MLYRQTVYTHNSVIYCFVQVLETVGAVVDDFYLKYIPKVKMKKIKSNMEADFGDTFSFDGINVTGTSCQIQEVFARLTEALGLPRDAFENVEDDKQSKNDPATPPKTKGTIDSGASYTGNDGRVHKGVEKQTYSNTKTGTNFSTRQDVGMDEEMDEEVQPIDPAKATKTTGTTESRASSTESDGRAYHGGEGYKRQTFSNTKTDAQSSIPHDVPMEEKMDRELHPNVSKSSDDARDDSNANKTCL